MHQKTTAFTLIELLVTIVIIGVLSTMSVSTYSDYFEKARLARAQHFATQTKKLFIAQNVSSSTRVIEGMYRDRFIPNPQGGSDNIFVDESDAGNNFRCPSMVSLSQDTPIGTGSSINLNWANCGDFIGSGRRADDKITLALWVKYTDNASGSDLTYRDWDSYLFYVGHNVGFKVSGDGAIYFFINGGQNSNNMGAKSLPKTIIKNKWHYIMGSYDGNTARLWVDGELMDSKDVVQVLSFKGPPPNFNYISLAYIFEGLLYDMMISHKGFDGETLK